MSKIKVKVSAASLVTDLDGNVLIDVSHTQLAHSKKGFVVVDAEASDVLSQQIAQRPELVYMGDVVPEPEKEPEPVKIPNKIKT